MVKLFKPVVDVGPGVMLNQEDLLKLAKRYFVHDAGLSWPQLIRKIQIAEGHLDCFATGKRSCEETGCRWRTECLADVTDAASMPIGKD